MGKRVTIQDIADELRLSRNTVSKALNNSEGIAEATRDRILQKAAEMGYKQFAFLSPLPALRQPDPEAVTPITSSDKREIALLSTTYLAAPHFSSIMLDAFQNNLAQLGLTLNTHRVTPANIEELTLPVTLDTSRVAAIICIEMFDMEYDRMLCGLDIPMLFVDTPACVSGETLPADQLIMENIAPVMRLTNGLIEAGYRRIGFVGNWEHCQSFFERYSAFCYAMFLAGVPVKERWVIKSNSIEDIATRLNALREEGNLPELLLCANDFVALDTMQVLYSMGLTIPGDIALAGFDDSSESRRCLPLLTTIHIHTQIMAYEAIRLIRSRIQEPSLNFRRVYTETDLIWRECTSTVR